MPAIPTLAAKRFGTGLAAGHPAPSGAEDLLAELTAPDRLAREFPVIGSAEVWRQNAQIRDLNLAVREGSLEARDARSALRHTLYRQRVEGYVRLLQRAVAAPTGFRERLQMFWANHFTVVDKTGQFPNGPVALQEDAIRPHLAGPFSAMLKAVETHPVMLVYLDQAYSTGPNSELGRLGKGGLNENLGRELMELHTLGVGAPYSQTDVRQLSRLLTGLSYRPGTGFVFDPKRADQSSEAVLGKHYGGLGLERIGAIHAALDDLATRPETARHVSTQLATYFVADKPDPDLIAHMAGAWQSSGGHLAAVYAAMLEHPAAWATDFAKVRMPFDYLAAALRSLPAGPEALGRLAPGQDNRLIVNALAVMGQPISGPPGPNGWPQTDAEWVQPQTLAARIQWAMTAPGQIAPDLPDPRVFVQTALADAASAELVKAAAQAETRREGVGLILASADFNRR